MDETKRTAAEIISVFEEYLHSKGVAIEEQDGEELEALICGSDYRELEERVAEILEEVRA